MALLFKIGGLSEVGADIPGNADVCNVWECIAQEYSSLWDTSAVTSSHTLINMYLFQSNCPPLKILKRFKFRWPIAQP